MRLLNRTFGQVEEHAQANADQTGKPWRAFLDTNAVWNIERCETAPGESSGASRIFWPKRDE